MTNPNRPPAKEELDMTHLIKVGMEASGFSVRHEDVLRVVQRFNDSDEPAAIKKAAEEARREGLSMLEAVTRFYGPPRPPDSKH